MRSSRSRDRCLSAAICLAAFLIPQPAPSLADQGLTVAQTGTPKVAPASELLLELIVNGRSTGEPALMVATPDRDFLVPGDVLKRAGLKLPATPPFTREGQALYSLRSLAGVSFRLDEPTQTLVLEASAEAFEAHVLEMPTVRTQASRSALGGFLNYDLLGIHTEDQKEYSGFIELGLFGRFGLGLGTWQLAHVGSETRGVRLDTTWQWDDPTQMTTLRVGDSINEPGLWGSALRFGGIQYARDFGTQPRFITFPLPVLRGDTIVPSAVDIYFNNAIITRREVPAGPFSIENIPTITGQGELRMVVRDAVGREQVIVQPIYSSINLLQEGLTDFSYEMGFVRRDFSIRSDRYGPMLGSATYRRGITDAFTAELHAQAADAQQAAGVAGDFVIQPYAAVNVAAAASHGEPGWGGLLNLGASAQFGPLSFSLLSRFETRRFRQVGEDPLLPPPSSTIAANLGIGGLGFGNLSLGYARSDNRSGDDVETVLATYQIPIFGRAFFQVLAVKNLSPVRSTSVIAGLSIPVGPPDNFHTLNVTHQNQKTEDRRDQDTFILLTRNLPAGPGWGYRLETATSGNFDFGELDLQTDFGTYTIAAERRDGQDTTRFLASGGVGLIGGRGFASRRIIDGFGQVEVPGVAGARVYADGQLLGSTDRDGTLVVPTLRAYDINHITIEPRDIPLDAVVEAVAEDVVPYARSGVSVRFPIRRSRSATLRVVQADGRAVPAGAVARVTGIKGEFPVALEGALFLTDLGPTNEVTVTWDGQRCRLTVVFLDTTDPLPDLGTLSCERTPE